jgi:hypothetical protein
MKITMVIEDKEQGGCEIYCDPPIMNLANMIAEKTTKSDAVGTALFLTRIAQLLFKGDKGIDEIITALKQAKGEESLLLKI